MKNNKNTQTPPTAWNREWQHCIGTERHSLIANNIACMLCVQVWSVWRQVLQGPLNAWLWWVGLQWLCLLCIIINWMCNWLCVLCNTLTRFKNFPLTGRLLKFWQCAEAFAPPHDSGLPLILFITLSWCWQCISISWASCYFNPENVMD